MIKKENDSRKYQKEFKNKLAGIISVDTILGDPGAVSRAERKGVTKVFKNRRKSHWVPTLTGPFRNGQAILPCKHKLGERTGQLGRDNSSRVRIHEKNSGDAVSRLGTIIQSIFCAQ